MRTIIIILLSLLLFTGCKKDKSGILDYTISYKSNNSKSRLITQSQNKTEGDTLYTQFGDYITSITPSKFIGKFGMIRFYDDIPMIPNGGCPPGHALTLINGAMLDPNDPVMFADFTNNKTMSVTPSLMGEVGSDGNYVQKEINFVLLSISAEYFYQEIELPVEYTSKSLTQFNYMYRGKTFYCDSVKFGNILKVYEVPLLQMVHHGDNDINGSCLNGFIYGCTDVTSIIMSDSMSIYPSLAPLMSPVAFVGGHHCWIWSHRYNPLKLVTPGEGETLTINTTISFDIQNLIQVYAGADNIPYTSDDIIVYAPNFWDRIYVNAAKE